MFGVRSLPFTPTAEANDTVVAAKLRYRAAQAAMIKAAAPGVTVVALGQGLFYTALLNRSELAAGGAFEHVDIFVPYCAQLGNASWAAAAESFRAKGKKVGCYSAANSIGDFGLDFGLEYSSARARLLVGTAAWRHKIDAFLYYGVTGWRGYGGNVDDWNFPYNRSQRQFVGTYTPDLRVVQGGYSGLAEVEDGEGQLSVPGPDYSQYSGILSTPMMVGVRDGVSPVDPSTLLTPLAAKGGRSAH